MNESNLATVFARRRSVRKFNDDAIALAHIERLIWAGQGETDDRGHRTAPSAHASYPLRFYVVASRVDGLNRGLYAASPAGGSLEPVHTRDIRRALQDAAVNEQPWLGTSAAILSICADFVAPCREFANQQPYGRRGSRYVYIEAGAAAQNIQLQATEAGIGSVLVAGFNDEATANALDLVAPLSPVLHLCLGYPLAGD